MQKNSLHSFLGIMQKSGCISSGYENVIMMINRKKCKLLILSEDAGEDTTDKLVKAADLNKIPYILFGLKEELGHSIGKSPRSCLSINDSGFANSFTEKITANKSGGEYIDKSQNI